MASKEFHCLECDRRLDPVTDCFACPTCGKDNSETMNAWRVERGMPFFVLFMLVIIIIGIVLHAVDV